MNDSRVQQAREQITGLQSYIKESKELVAELLDADGDWSALDMRDVKLARSELNKALMGLGGAYACLSRITARQQREAAARGVR